MTTTREINERADVRKAMKDTAKTLGEIQEQLRLLTEAAANMGRVLAVLADQEITKNEAADFLDSDQADAARKELKG